MNIQKVACRQKVFLDKKQACPKPEKWFLNVQHPTVGLGLGNKDRCLDTENDRSETEK